MKKVIALGVATCFAFSAYANQQIVNTGKTFNNFTPIFQSGSPERVSLFPTSEEYRARDIGREGFQSSLQVIVIGGRNSNQAEAGQYYFPKTSSGSIVFNSAVDTNNEGTNTLQLYWNGTQDATFGVGSTTQADFSGTGTHNIAYATTGPNTATTNTATLFSISAGNGTAGTGVAGNIAYMTSATLGQPVTNSTDGTVGGGAGDIGNFVVENGTAGTYAPYDLTTLTALVNNDAVLGLDDNGFRVDTNRNTAIVRPWNFGIGYAPNVQMGQNVSESAFVSTITPELERSFWGIGATWKQVLSDKDTGFWLELSTVLQRVTMNMKLNEEISTELTAAPAGSVTEWSDSWGTNNGYATSDITTVTQAFAQEAWLYGKIDGAQSITRLADIEFKVGYQFICNENVLSNGYVGMVIPTGNKATAAYMAEPIVGNGFHFGLMAGGTYEIQLNHGDHTRWSMRSDTCYRYLFKNTQVRSFDTYNGNWSRYMYVWENYAAEQLAELTADSTTLRAYTPGINVFTQEVNVTPQGQIRFNQALILESGGFKGELGWNVFMRQDEIVDLVNAWQENTIAYADASQQLYSLYNANRTIYNDAYQSAPIADTTANGSLERYNAASVQRSDLNLNSAAALAAMTNTPYLVLGYGFGEERSSVVSLGGSYEFSASNAYINTWMLWGKFSCTF